MVANLVSPAEYFRRVAASPVRLEYLAGRIREMAGGRREHSEIQTGLSFQPELHRRRKEIHFFGPDQAVRAANSYLFPDGCLARSPEFLHDSIDILVNPIVVFEILSPSSENYDRGEKFRLYQGIPSVQDYILISADQLKVEIYTRTPSNEWTINWFTDPSVPVKIPSLDLNLDLAILYEHVF